MGFWDTLGQGIEQYAKNKLRHGSNQQSPAGRFINYFHPHDTNPYSLDRTPATQPDPNTAGAGVQPGPPSPQSMNQMVNPEASLQGGPDLSMDSASVPEGVDMMGAGQIVTKPTLAVVGDKGPEAIQPLTDQPGAKVPPGMLGAGPRTRWGHPGGPNASKRTSPVHGLLPVKPNAPFR